jgi:hypothetical protein
MPKSTGTHAKKRQSSIIPHIEKLLSEQTSVILQAVDEKLSAQGQADGGEVHRTRDQNRGLSRTNA